MESMFRNKICSFSPLSEKNCKSFFVYYDVIIPEIEIKSKRKYRVLGVSLYVSRHYVFVKNDITFAFQVLVRLISNLYFSKIVPAIRLFSGYGKFYFGLPGERGDNSNLQVIFSVSHIRWY